MSFRGAVFNRIDILLIYRNKRHPAQTNHKWRVGETGREDRSQVGVWSLPPPSGDHHRRQSGSLRVPALCEEDVAGGCGPFLSPG